MSDLMDDLPTRLAATVGSQNVIVDPTAMGPYLMEWRGLFRGRANAIVLPCSVDQMSAVLRLAQQTKTPIIPQGGNTGLVGGQVPTALERSLVVSLKRMNRIRDIDSAGNTMIVESGATLQQVRQAAEGVDRLFPLSLASEGSCTIGGNLATNAGGISTLAYGNARDLALGLEVVLADGRVWNGLSRLRKDNTGFDLRNLFIGSEGALGVITAASLKLFPRPKSIATAFCGLSDPEAALKLLACARDQAGQDLTAFEILPRFGLDLVLRHIPVARDPLEQRCHWYALIEIASQRPSEAEPIMLGLLQQGIKGGLIEDAAIANSITQQNAFWRLREAMSEAQKHDGGSIKHDISVPIAAIANFIQEASLAVLARIPEARLLPFGHAGDGNIHFNVSQPVGANKEDFLACWDEVNDIVHQIAMSHGGSISAEHGIGRLKRDLLLRFKDPVAIELMRSFKVAIDPERLMNPGVVL